MGNPSFLSCHNMKLALNVPNTKNNFDFVYGLYFAFLLLLLLEKCSNLLFHQRR